MFSALKRHTAYLFFCAAFLIGLSGSAPAQSNAKYPFILPTKSKLQFGSDSTPFMKFYKKLDELRSKQRDHVVIAHFGGSHIQAGLWSEKLIDNFQALDTTMEGGGAFAFPFKVAKTNGPPFYKSFTNGQWKRCRCALAKEMCPDLGVAGIAAITNDSANYFGIKLTRNNHLQNFNQVKVYHNFNPSFELYLGESATLHFERVDEPKKGYSLFTFESYIDSICFQIIRKDTLHKDFMLRGLSLENNKRGFYYASFGVNGASSNSFLRCPNFTEELKDLKPDLVILSLGVNDTQGKNFTKAEYIANYDSLISNIRKAAPDCAILFTTTTDNYIHRKTPNKRPIAAEAAMYDLMEKHKAAVWDAYAVMGGYKSIYKWYKAGLAAKDKVHFNSRGYALLGQMMFDAILQSYQYNSKLPKGMQ